MVDLLVGKAAVVLEDVVVDSASSCDELLGHGQNLAQVVIRDVG